MRKLNILLSLLLGFVPFINGFAQPANRLLLKNGSWDLSPNLNIWATGRPLPQEMVWEGKVYALVHFTRLPQAEQHLQLEKSGVTLVSYLPKNTYLAIMPAVGFNASGLAAINIDGIYPMAQTMKLSSEVSLGNFPEHAIRGNNRYAFDVKFWQPALAQSYKGVFQRNDRQVERDFGFGGLFRIVTTLEDAQNIASYPFIDVVEFASAPDEFNNLSGKNNQRANVLGSNLIGNRNLQGTGVAVGIGDGGFVQPHLDFQGRLIQTDSAIIASFGDHGDHVAGTVGGAGIINPENAGMAPECLLITAQASNIVSITPQMYAQYGMVITNNSYGNQFNCATVGVYNSLSNSVDQQILDYPDVMHVFAAANSGGQTCTPLPAGYRTVAPGLNIGKNITTLANVSDVDVISSSSSRGPTLDGRVKPEISATGGNVVSTIPTNTYGSKSGTSMASPGYSGTLAQLTQRFRQLNNNANPNQALLKAITCNTADDVGNANVDFLYGFGRVNGRRAVEAIEGGRYLQSTLSQGVTNTHALTIPAGVERVKVLLYWSDRPGNPAANKSLVNDLDLQLVSPSNAITLPWVLNPATDSWLQAATRKVDTLNNIEQVTLDVPAAGNYTIRVIGSEIPLGSQPYFITWELMTTSQTKLTFPLGGERLVAGTAYQIRWDAYPGTGGTWSVDLSTDNGTSWSNIVSNLNTFTRNRSWTPSSSLFTNQARIRVTNVSGTAGTSSSEASFTIAPIPSLSTTSCDATGRVSWSSVSGASAYEVFILQNDNWVPVATTASTSFSFTGLQNGQTYWTTVRARNSAGVIGRFAGAVSFTPTAGVVCNNLNDVGVYDLITSAVGRQNTSTAYSANQTITVRVRNFGTNSINQTIPIKYRVNNGSVFTDNVPINLASATTGSNITLSTGLNLSAPGTYNLDVWTDVPGDGSPANDTLHATLTSIANNPVSLPITENFSGLETITNLRSATPISGLNAWDYIAPVGGRLRSGFLNSNLPAMGRALTLDKSTDGGASVFNQLIWTINLSSLAANADPRLDFDFISHREVSSSNDRVWVRGSDTQPWVELYNLGANLGTAGEVRQVRALSIKSALGAQSITSSFQIRIGQENSRQAQAINFKGGLSFDNFRIYDPGQDLRVVALVAPVTGCGLSATNQVTISVENLTNTNATSVPVFFRLNQGAWQQGTISTINAGATVNYTFPQTVNLGTPGDYTFSIRVANATDLNPLNDSLLNRVITSVQTIASFPYLETFESSNGQFRTYGTNSTWQWGSPASGTKLNIRTASSGSNVWVTNLNGTYAENELSYLESPCFNMSSLGSNPTVSFRNQMYLESGYDYVWVEYSTNGTTWTLLGANGSGTNWYNSSSPQAWNGDFTSWRTSSFVFPLNTIAVGSRSSIRFRVVMSADYTLNEDGVAIDDFSVAIPTSNTITTGAVSGTNFCAGVNVSVPFTITGTFNAGNVFTAQLSDTNRSFTSPVNIGTLSSISAGTINAVIPTNSLNGSRYRIRVVSSNPSVQGTDNNTNLVISNPALLTPATPSLSVSSPICSGSSFSASIPQFSGANSYQWELPAFLTATSGSTTNNISLAATNSGTGTVRVRAVLACGNTAYSSTVSITVNSTPTTPSITAGGPTTFCSGGSVTLFAPAGFAYLWSNNATTQSINVTSAGSYTVRTIASGCTSSVSAATVVTVNNAPTIPSITAGGPTTFCDGGSVTLSAPAGFAYLWSNNATTQSINVTSAGSYTVRTIASGCTSSVSAATVVTVNNCGATWVGGTSNDWNNPVNWSGGVVPNASTNINIPAGTGFNIQLGASVSCNNLTIEANASLNLGTGTLNVKGDANLSGSAIGTTGKLALNGTSQQTLTGNAATVSLLELDNSNGINFSGAIDITNGLLLKGGNINNNAGTFTLKSNSSGTAYLDNFSSGYSGVLSSPIRFERFSSGGFRHVGSPLTGQLLSALNVSCFMMRKFNEPTNSWIPVGMNCQQLGFTGLGGVSFNSLPATTVTFTGTPNSGLIAMPLVRSNSVLGGPATGWNSLYNPYPSPIDWNIVKTLGSNASITNGSVWVWNSSLNQWATLSPLGVAVNGASNIIAAGQGFLVRRLTVGTTGSNFTFNNAARLALNTNRFLRSGNQDDNETIRLKLTGNGKSDESVIHITPLSSSELDENDAERPISIIPDFELSTLASSGEKLMVNAVSLSSLTDIPLTINISEPGKYRLDLSENRTNLSVYFFDVKTGIITDAEKGVEINLEGNADFSARYKLIFKNKSISQSSIFSAWAVNSDEIKVLTADGDVTGIEIFNALGQKLAFKQEILSSSESFMKLDNPFSGVVFIRLGNHTERVVMGR